MAAPRAVGLPAATASRRLVIALGATTALLWVGASAILPLLPSYLRARGATPGLVGVIMAAYYAASVLTQYPAGRLADAVGARAVVTGGLVLFAGASAGFALAGAPAAAIGFRALEGVGAGAVTVAGAAAIGALVAPGERGGAFGALYGSQMLALAVGPLLGSLVGAASMRVLFLGASGCALLAVVPLALVLRDRATGDAPRRPVAAPGEAGPGPTGPGAAVASPPGPSAGAGRCDPEPATSRSGRADPVARNALLGVALVFGATGLTTGVYESCWTLLLRLRHASAFDVGLSWTLFALPFALLSVPAGHLAHRLDRRALTLVALCWSAGFCALYPELHAVGLLVGLGVAEAVGTVIGAPPAVLILSEAASGDRQGAAQGVVETARTAATAVAAAASGALFGIGTRLPFDVAAGLVLVAAVVVAWCWRHLPGRSSLTAEADDRPLLAAEASAGVPESPPRRQRPGR